MTADLRRLLCPKSLAVVGGGAWGEAVIQQAQKFGFAGDIWPIHPSRDTLAGLPTFRGIPDLPGAPDATFIGINRDATIGAVERLARANAGGAVCFASGFAEADAEDPNATSAQDRLLKAAGELPVLGPNCYGFINALDRTIVWPDQHGMQPVDRGVAILTQSSNIAINLTFQNRSLPLAMMITCGNMAQLSQADIVLALLDDSRITAIGLHIEGFTDLPGWELAAHKARDKGVPLIAIKAGRSEAARAATISHTASLAGEDAGADALLAFLGIGRVNTLPELLEALKLAHVYGYLKSAQIASISCSGGEASLAADLADMHGVTFPSLSEEQSTTLRDVLGPKVALANPLDYHTYIWRDPAKMAQAWSAMSAPEVALTLSIVDIPDAGRSDPSDWDCAIDAAISAKDSTDRPFAVVSTLPETMPHTTAAKLLAHGIAPLQGLSETMAAVSALATKPPRSGLVTAPVHPNIVIHHELETKEQLASMSVSLPRRFVHSEHTQGDLHDLRFPVVVKADRVAHKTDDGALVLNVQSVAEAEAALSKFDGGFGFVEEMVQGSILELLVTFTNDPAHGVMLTIGAGGTLTELWQDTQQVMLPVDADLIDATLSKLRVAPLLDGYRGKPAVDRAAIVRAILALQTFVLRHLDGFVELEVNPLICTIDDAVVADALWHQSFPEMQS